MLGSMLGSFQSLYPTGSLLTELVQIYQGKYIVKASLQIEGVTRTTAMAAAEVLETAEDYARQRAIAFFGSASSAIMQTQSIAATTEAAQPAILKPDAIAISVGAINPAPELTTPVEQVEPTLLKPDVPVSTPVVPEELAVAVITEPAEPTLLKPNVPASTPTIPEPVVALVTEQVEPTLLKSDVPVSTPAIPELAAALVTEQVEPTLLKSDVAATIINDAFVQATPRMNSAPEISQVPVATIQPEPIEEPLFDPALENIVKSDRSELPLTVVPTPSNVTPFTPRNYNPPAEIELPPPQTTTTTNKRKKTTQPKDNSDDIAKIAVEMERLQWTIEQGKDYLFQTYRKKSRHLLSDDELRDFREYLESKPTPVEEPLAIDPVAGF